MITTKVYLSKEKPDIMYQNNTTPNRRKKHKLISSNFHAQMRHNHNQIYLNTSPYRKRPRILQSNTEASNTSK